MANFSKYQVGDILNSVSLTWQKLHQFKQQFHSPAWTSNESEVVLFLEIKKSEIT